MDWFPKYLLGSLAMMILWCEGTPDAGSYIVDCSACNSVPVIGVDSYTCKVRCEVEGETNMNLTGLYDMLVQVLNEQKILKEQLENTTQELNAAKEMLKIEVAFSAQLPHEVTSVGAAEVIKFPDIVSNVGNGYDAATGKFTAPYSGTYAFTLVIMNAKVDQIYAYIKLNGAKLCIVHVTNAIYQTGTCTAIKKLAVGDQVWAENRDQETLNFNKKYNSLSGYLTQLDY